MSFARSTETWELALDLPGFPILNRSRPSRFLNTGDAVALVLAAPYASLGKKRLAFSPNSLILALSGIFFPATMGTPSGQGVPGCG